MKEIRLSLKRVVDDSYQIQIGAGIFDTSLTGILKNLAPTHTAIVMDTNLAGLYRQRVEQVLTGSAFTIHTFAAGEENKTMTTLMQLFGQLSAQHLDRKAVIVAIGGGVTGDMAGFLAAVYLRGIRFVQVPTSLLAMVDSSIGGKTAVDTDSGKNLIGAFHQPQAVILDTDFLKTLPVAEFRNGMAEVIKHAAIMDEAYARELLENEKAILSLQPEALTDMIMKSCAIKARVVEKDEKENDLRQILNFGHTLGHAIEKASNYEIPHGYSVALGMMGEAFIGMNRGITPDTDLGALKKLLKGYGLLAYAKVFHKIADKAIIEACYGDKKNVSRRIHVVLIQKMGQVSRKKNSYSYAVSADDVLEALDFLKKNT